MVAGDPGASYSGIPLCEGWPNGDQLEKGIREGSLLEECVLTTPSSVSTCQCSLGVFPFAFLLFNKSEAHIKQVCAYCDLIPSGQ